MVTPVTLRGESLPSGWKFIQVYSTCCSMAQLWRKPVRQRDFDSENKSVGAQARTAAPRLQTGCESWLEPRAQPEFLPLQPSVRCSSIPHSQSTELDGMQEVRGKAAEDRVGKGFRSTDSALFQKLHAVTQELSIADETTEL